MRNPETRTRYLRRLLIKIKNQYPSEDNVTIITLFFGLASGRMERGGGQHDRRRPRAMQPLIIKFKTKLKLCELGHFYWLPKISETANFRRCST